MDRLRTLKWPVIVLSLGFSLAMLFGVRWLVLTQTIGGPLTKFLEASPAVSRFEVNEEQGIRVVRVDLKDVPNLHEAYIGIDGGIQSIIGKQPYRLQVGDRRSPELAAAFYQVNPMVQEAMATGRYSILLPGVEQQARELGLDRARISMDSRRVYLQLHHGSDYLYETFERPEQARHRSLLLQRGGEAE